MSQRLLSSAGGLCGRFIAYRRGISGRLHAPGHQLEVGGFVSSMMFQACRNVVASPAWLLRDMAHPCSRDSVVPMGDSQLDVNSVRWRDDVNDDPDDGE